MRFLERLVEVVYWLGYVLITTVIFAFVAFLLALEADLASSVAWTIVAAGSIVGVVLAEYIRRKYGLSAAWNRYHSDVVDEDANSESDVDTKR